jgi:hypothetical protein
MNKRDVYLINLLLDTVEIPDDNVMLQTLLDIAKEQEQEKAA